LSLSLSLSHSSGISAVHPNSSEAEADQLHACLHHRSANYPNMEPRGSANTVCSLSLSLCLSVCLSLSLSPYPTSSHSLTLPLYSFFFSLSPLFPPPASPFSSLI